MAVSSRFSRRAYASEEWLATGPLLWPVAPCSTWMMEESDGYRHTGTGRIPGRSARVARSVTPEVHILDHVVAWVGLAMLVVVTVIMIVGFVAWLVSSIRRLRDR